jgi:hypothetical protein
VLGDVVAIVRALGADPDFDELVLVEGVVDGGGHGVGEAVFPELDDGLKVMAERAEVAALLSCEVHLN